MYAKSYQPIPWAKTCNTLRQRYRDVDALLTQALAHTRTYSEIAKIVHPPQHGVVVRSQIATAVTERESSL